MMMYNGQLVHKADDIDNVETDNYECPSEINDVHIRLSSTPPDGNLQRVYNQVQFHAESPADRNSDIGGQWHQGQISENVTDTDGTEFGTIITVKSEDGKVHLIPLDGTSQHSSICDIDQEDWTADDVRNKNTESRGTLLSQIYSEVQVSDSEVKFECVEDECGKIYSSHKSLLSHMLTHKNKNKCTVSLLKVKKKQEGISGCFSHHKESSNRHNKFQCAKAKCGRVFRSHNDLLKHKRGYYHQNEKKEKRFSSLNKPANPKNKKQSLQKSASDCSNPHFKCSKPGCNKMFQTKYLLKKHGSVHLTSPYTCTEPGCGKLFKSPRAWREHQTIHFGMQLPCDEPGCGKVFKTKKSLREHKKIHFDLQLPCDEPGCGKVFKTKKNLREHEQIHLGHHGQYECSQPDCDKVFKTKRSVREHVRIIHFSNEMCCSKCGIICKSSKYLREHEKQHRGEPFICLEPGCNKIFMSARTLKNHEHVHGNEEHPCMEAGCGKVFKHKDFLRSHLKTHLVLECFCQEPGCGKVFKSKRNLREHQKLHSGILQFPCLFPECGKIFQKPSNLTRHGSIHEQQEYPCTEPGCHKILKSARGLSEHHELHSGESHHCSVVGCEKTFTGKRQLKHHIKYAHSDKAPLLCSLCGKTFKHARSLNRHQAVHEPSLAIKQVQCVTCNKEFKNKHLLKNHMLFAHNDGIQPNMEVIAPMESDSAEDDEEEYEDDTDESDTGDSVDVA